MIPSVEYLRHQIDASGMQEKVEAIVKAPAPQNVAELRSFLGLINYCGKFVPNPSTILHHLNDLLKAERKWEWSSECGKAFKFAKEQLSSTNSLCPINLAADASTYGVGAVVSHVFPDGQSHLLHTH